MFDDIFEGVQAFLNGKHKRVVNGANMVGHFLRRGDIRASLEANAEAVHLGPPCFGIVFIVHALLREVLGNCCNDGRVESTADEETVRHIAHQMRFDALFERGAQFFLSVSLLWSFFPIHPGFVVIPRGGSILRRPHMTGREFTHILAQGFDAFHF